MEHVLADALHLDVKVHRHVDGGLTIVFDQFLYPSHLWIKLESN